MSYCTVWSPGGIAVDIRLKCKDIKRPKQEKTKLRSKSFVLGCLCDWCSPGGSSSIQHKPARGLLISPRPPWLCVLSSVWQATSVSFQPPATGLAQLPLSLAQRDLMDSNHEAVNQAAILGSLSCLWESLSGQWLYQQSIDFFFMNKDDCLYKTGVGSC